METNLSTSKELAIKIKSWIWDYATKNHVHSLVVGVSGGVDSGLVSTLCAMTDLPTFLVSMPIRQEESQLKRANDHIEFLCEKFPNCTGITVDLTEAFSAFEKTMVSNPFVKFDSELALANSRSRLRMTTLYHIAGTFNGIVVGTGNKVEDFGIGFYTKYGDGGVDISPIVDLMKSEVREMARALEILPEISEAVPTDGLWGDSRSDEDQIGASYDELEWAMSYIERNPFYSPNDLEKMTSRQREVISIYKKFHSRNSHKMNPIPVFSLYCKTLSEL